ncbi:HSPB1-associated protein 1 [Anthonomus grandis grandis]|uniref:HSPB1-associated protein 1 n=1 Tax=Anthonomus grandis grandis TaxID=2921223 RepID=UPI0021664515|nr:HSPB1-associated protein 1 [Anthonomus grandis grandis]
MSSNSDNLLEFRELILNSKKPLLIKNLVQCELTSWTLEQWTDLLKNDNLQFRCGTNAHTKEPQWESLCQIRTGKFQDFLNETKSNENDWWYFDYKYLCEWFTNKEAFKEKINWSSLGFPEITANESTIWIGSKGAHTPCHVDTYGCNMVMQLYGRKMWLLFSPEQNLKQTRIPFEESSIYSQLNFFSPDIENFKDITNCHKLILNPGDILIVPHKWWHYVENLEMAISINAWLPLPQDDYERVKESIATILVRNTIHGERTLQSLVLNPNMANDMITCDEALNIIKSYKDKLREDLAKKSSCGGSLEIILSKHKNISKVPTLSDMEFKQFLTSQSERFKQAEETKALKNLTHHQNMLDFLEVVTDNKVLDLIAKKLIQK